LPRRTELTEVGLAWNPLDTSHLQVGRADFQRQVRVLLTGVPETRRPSLGAQAFQIFQRRGYNAASGSCGSRQRADLGLEVSSGKGVELLELIKLDDAIKDLADEDESLARLIEMRYFGGMTAEETAEALGLSVHVVRHDLRFAQAWLRRKLTQ